MNQADERAMQALPQSRQSLERLLRLYASFRRHVAHYSPEVQGAMEALIGRAVRDNADAQEAETHARRLVQLMAAEDDRRGFCWWWSSLEDAP